MTLCPGIQTDRDTELVTSHSSLNYETFQQILLPSTVMSSMMAGATAKIFGLTGVKTLYSSSLPNYDFEVGASGDLEHPDASHIERDEFAVPTCTAQSEHDVFFLQGVTQAQDRLWQIHAARMCARGRLCEFGGLLTTKHICLSILSTLTL